MEAAVLSGITGIQTPVTGALNTFTPTRGTTTIVSQVVVAEKISDIPGEWTPTGMPQTGMTTLVFYKRRDALVTANIPQAVARLTERVTDKAKHGILKFMSTSTEKKSSREYADLEKTEKAQEKTEKLREQAAELKEKMAQKRYKCRCSVPIAVHYSLQLYRGLPPDYVLLEKQGLEAYANAMKNWESRTNPFIDPGPPPVKPENLRAEIWLFASARADIGSGMVNSLGEALNFTITLVPQWDPQLRRYLNIAWKASGAGMRFSKGFEHSGVAVAMIGLVRKTSPYDEATVDGAGLVPAPQQDQNTTHYFLEGKYGTTRPDGAEPENPEIESDEEDPVELD
jgi:hypothetical protein